MDPEQETLLKNEGRLFLEPLVNGCTRCSLRRRGGFSWVWEPCGACNKGGLEEVAQAGTAMTAKVRVNSDFRWLAAVSNAGWKHLPKWGAKYLAGDAKGPLPAPWVVYQARDAEPTIAAPGWVARLLLLGNPMKSYVKKTGAVAIRWPHLFGVVAAKPELRAAVDATVMLSEDGDFKPTENTCEKLYNFLLELEVDTVFGGAAQENTQQKPQRVSDADFGPPIRVLGKLIR